MNDIQWQDLMSEAERRARTGASGDALDYFNLRAVNDDLRRAGIEWLFTTCLKLISNINRANSNGVLLSIEKNDSHRFREGSSTMIGTRIMVTSGGEFLVFEVGWPRTPKDGIVRGGGLACGLITSSRKERRMLLLFRQADGSTRWHEVSRTGSRIKSLSEFNEASVNLHIHGLIESS